MRERERENTYLTQRVTFFSKETLSFFHAPKGQESLVVFALHGLALNSTKHVLFFFFFFPEVNLLSLLIKKK